MRSILGCKMNADATYRTTDASIRGDETGPVRGKGANLREKGVISGIPPMIGQRRHSATIRSQSKSARSVKLNCVRSASGQEVLELTERPNTVMLTKDGIFFFGPCLAVTPMSYLLHGTNYITHAETVQMMGAS